MRHTFGGCAENSNRTFHEARILGRAMPTAHWIQRHKQKIKRFLSLIGYDHRLWARCVMYDRCFEMLRLLEPETLDVLEISAGPVWRGVGFRSFTQANYPPVYILRDALESKFDPIISHQIFA